MIGISQLPSANNISPAALCSASIPMAHMQQALHITCGDLGT